MHYIIELSSDSSIIGSQYPQIQKMKLRYDYDGPCSVYKLGRCYQSLPDFTPDLDGFVLHARAKPTDFLSNVFSPFGFIVSKKVKNILQGFKLPIHAFYPLKIHYRKGILDNYYWFHVICDLTDIVNYPDSTFFIKTFNSDLGDIAVSSKDDFFKKRENIKEQNPRHNITISAKKLKFTQKVDYDFFSVGRIDPFDYISEDLNIVLIKEKVNGIITHPLLYEFY